ncbi:MAG: 1-deoxy-D-xylulose-5-phosphate reductoisomerase, partial [Ignavibacteria bacterium]
KKILILGSTGSIGRNTLDVIRNFPDKFKTAALSVNTRIDLLEPQIEEFKPSAVVVKDPLLAETLKKSIGSKCEVLSGIEGLISIAANMDYDIFVGAMVGFAGLAPTIEAIKRGKRIALANKETLVVGGELVTSLSRKYYAEIIPVDSEHSAIYQCLSGEKISQVAKLILTASGGPFLYLDKKEFCNVNVKDALNHPNWKMGNKITIDSASMMNKGLEVIEAKWLFGLPKEKIEVVIHPQSIIHSMVEFADGSIKAQLGLPDMRVPIQYALTYPERLPNQYPKTDFKRIKNLSFIEPDLEKFECLKLAYDVLNTGGCSPIILNAANEIAVDRFLKGNITFSRIPYIIKKALDKVYLSAKYISTDLDSIFEYDSLTREYVLSLPAE